MGRKISFIGRWEVLVHANGSPASGRVKCRPNDKGKTKVTVQDSDHKRELSIEPIIEVEWVHPQSDGMRTSEHAQRLLPCKFYMKL